MLKPIAPMLSVIIVNYNGWTFVRRCVNSILSSNYPNLEIIVVDNGSTDGSAERLAIEFADKVKVLTLDRNYGPAKARNDGVAISDGKYISFLDNDTIVDANWASSPIKKFESDPSLGIIQCKLLLLKEPNRIDYVGEYLGQYGFLVQLAMNGEVDRGQYNNCYEILAAKSAGMFIRRETFEKAGGFDPDYFIFAEETDLGWRSWLVGYRCILDFESIVYHEFGSSSLVLSKNQLYYNAKFHATKNYVMTLIKNLSSYQLIMILPLHIVFWLGISYYYLKNKQLQSFLLVHKALFWNAKNLALIRAKRRQTQKSRVVTDDVLLPIIMRKRNLSYFIRKMSVRNKFGNDKVF